MRKSAIATTLLLTISAVAFILDMTQQGYMTFTSADDIKKALPNFTTPQFAQLLTGSDQGCLKKGTQTKKVTRAQINTLRQLTSPEQAQMVLGNAYCETAKGLVYLTESGKKLTLSFDQALDYDFDSAPKSLSNTQERSSKESNGITDRPVRSRVQTPISSTARKSTQD